MKGGARENRPPPGFEKSMLIFSRDKSSGKEKLRISVVFNGGFQIKILFHDRQTIPRMDSLAEGIQESLEKIYWQSQD
jgi:hypothetical protein